MSELRVRRAREVDAPEIARLVAAAFAPFVERTGVRPAPLATDWQTVASAHGGRVAVIDDRIVGVLVLWPHPDHVLVETVAVAPMQQGRGVGALLLDVAEREAIEAGVNEVRLATKAAMTEDLAYYPRRGYAEAGRYREHGFDRVRFVKRLAPGA